MSVVVEEGEKKTRPERFERMDYVAGSAVQRP